MPSKAKTSVFNFLKQPYSPHDPYQGSLHPPGTAAAEAKAIFDREGYGSYLEQVTTLEIPPDAAPEQGGYDHPPGDRNTVRWHGASDSLRSARVLPRSQSVAVSWRPSVDGETPAVRFSKSLIRLRQVLPQDLRDRLAQAWLSARLAGVQSLEPETARGSDPALHCGHWLVLTNSPTLCQESNPARLATAAAEAVVRLCSEAAVAGHLLLLVLRIVDPPAALRLDEYNAGFKWWYLRVLGRPLPNHWDFGIGAAGAFKGSIATGLHLDHHDEPETHSCVASISIGDSGFQDLLMHVPQLRLLAPCDDGDALLFPARRYRHTNVGGHRPENRLAITWFFTARQLWWGLRCFQYMVARSLAAPLAPVVPGAPLFPSARLPPGISLPDDDSLQAMGRLPRPAPRHNKGKGMSKGKGSKRPATARRSAATTSTAPPAQAAAGPAPRAQGSLKRKPRKRARTAARGSSSSLSPAPPSVASSSPLSSPPLSPSH